MSTVVEKSSKIVLLPRAVVNAKVTTKVGTRMLTARIMMDNGSQATMITKNFI